MRGSTNITNAPGVSYTQSTGRITIPAEQVTGHISISGTPGVASFSVTATANTRLSNPAAQFGADYNTVLIPNAGWGLPAAVTMTRDNVNFNSYTYDNVTGAIFIARQHVLGDFRISATTPPAT